jgi:hypothetical protein
MTDYFNRTSAPRAAPHKPALGDYLSFKFRPGMAVGFAYLNHAADRSKMAELVDVCDALGIAAEIDPKVDYLLLKPGNDLLARLNAFATMNRIDRHAAMLMLLERALTLQAEERSKTPPAALDRWAPEIHTFLANRRRAA